MLFCNYSRTALHWASKRNHAQVVKYLLEVGASADILNNDNKTPDFYTKNIDIKKLMKPGRKFFIRFQIYQRIYLISLKDLMEEASLDNVSQLENSSFTPAYLKNPSFHYANKQLYSSMDASIPSPEMSLVIFLNLFSKEI